MFCSRCGTWAPDDSTSCPLCGLALQVDNWPREAKPIPPTPTPAPVLELVTYAGFWRRFAGLVIDFVVTFFPIATVRVMLGLPAWAPFEPPSVASSWAGLFGLLIDWLYAAFFMSSSMRGTLGQQIMDLHVTDLRGERISFARATGRYAAQLLNLFTVGFGLLIQLFNARRQALHDMVTGTVVVRPRRAAAAVRPAMMRLVP